MSLSKVNYVSGQTVITADNLNEIQECILQNEEDITSKSSVSVSSSGTSTDEIEYITIDGSEYKIAGGGGGGGAIQHIKVNGTEQQIADATVNLAVVENADFEQFQQSVQGALDGKIAKSAQATKTSAQNSPVGIDANGKLWYDATGGQGGGGDMLKSVYDADEAVADAGGIANYVEGHGGAVASVNGQTGAVELDAEDVGALPDSTVIPTALSDLTSDATHRLVTDTEKSTWNAKGSYSKPSGGIPKADLASAVQTSLGLADSALQSVPSTYRTSSAQDIIDAGKVDTSDFEQFQQNVQTKFNALDALGLSVVNGKVCQTYIA